MSPGATRAERVQVDLRREAHNLWRFNQNFARDGRVALPMPLYPWVSPVRVPALTTRSCNVCVALRLATHSFVQRVFQLRLLK